MKTPVRALALLSTAAMALALGTTATASASPASMAGPEVLAKNIAGPLSLGVADDGSVYVSEDNGGQLLHVVPGADPVVVYKEKGVEVGAVSVSGDRVVFATTGKSGKKVYEIVAGGAATQIANVGKYEKTKNPDKHSVYGFQGLSDKCAATLPKQVSNAYNGIVDSHPYSSEQVGDVTYIGEAAGNDILAISATGEISTVAVLPPTYFKATKAVVKATHLDACVTGHKFGLEPVPTDVEMGPDGWLYVSSLPGGPEDGSLGAQGRVYKVNPKSGAVKMVAGGFISTVDVAVADNGDVYVAQLFTGQVSVIKASSGKVKPFMQLSMPGAIDWTPDYLYAATDALKVSKQGVPGGKLVRIAW